MDTFVKYYCNKHAQHLYSHMRQWVNKHNKTLIVITIFIILAILYDICAFAWNPDHVRLGDIIFHSQRVTELSQDVFHGKFPIVDQFAQYPRGIATNIFYPWLTFLPFALIAGIFKPLTGFEIIAMLFTFTRYTVAYFAYQTFDKSRRHALVFAVLYGSCITSFYWLYMAEDIGATLAMIFLPLVFFGLIALLRRNNWRMMTIGLLLIGYSHIITITLLIFFLIVFVAINYRKFDVKQWVSWIKAGTISVILSAPEWLPLLYLKLNNNVYLPSQYTPDFSHGLMEFTQNPMGVAMPILALLTIFSGRKFNRFDKQMYGLAFISFFINAHDIGNLLYTFVPPIRVIQYSIRVSLIGDIAIVYLIMRYLVYLPNDRHRYIQLLFNKFIVLLLICSTVLGCVVSYPMSYVMHGHEYTIATGNNMIRYYNKHGEFPPKRNYFVTNHVLQQRTNAVEYIDYAPQAMTKHNSPISSHQLYGYGHKRYLQHMSGRVSLSQNNVHIKIQKDSDNVQVPITLYKGLRYKITLDGHNLRRSQMNRHLIKRTAMIIIKSLPAGSHTVSIKSVKF